MVNVIFIEELGYYVIWLLIVNNICFNFLFVVSDFIVIGVICVLKEVKIKVFDDVYVVGFDNIVVVSFVNLFFIIV